MISVEVLDKEKKSGRVVFLVKDSTPAFLNAIRRTILESVPTMAIEHVQFFKNSSTLYDEILAHRLGLVVLRSDIKSYELPSACKCQGEGCARCTLTLTLKAKGAGIVTATEIKSKDPKIKPAFEDTPIVKLYSGQELEFEATAVMGVGKNHVKWAPGLVWFKHYPLVTIDGKQVKNVEALATAQLIDMFETNTPLNKEERELFVQKFGLGADSREIMIAHSQNEFVLYVEPWGQLTPKEMVLSALEIMQEGLHEIEEQVKQ